jgi:hypothetical protein
MIGGAIQTTPTELEAYQASVPRAEPSAPTNVTAVGVGSNSATISFTAPSYIGRTPVSSYTVISSPGGFRTTGSSSPLSITGLSNQNPYTFTVYATNSAGNSVESAPSNQISLATEPDAPTITSVARNGSGAIAVSFTPGSNGGSAITGYTITSSPGGITASGSSSPISVSGLTNGTSYTFTMIATNAVGNSDPSSASSSITPATVPNAPTGLGATAGNGQLTITFTPGANGGSAITNYSYSLNGGSYTPISPATGAVSSVTIAGLSNGTSYTVRLKAINAIGESVASAPVTGTPTLPSSRPSPPTALSGVGGNQALYVLFTPGADGGAAITNYEYSIDGGETFTPFSPAQIYSPVEIRDPVLQNEQSYTVLLKAVNSAGSSDASASIQLTPTVNQLLSTNRLIRLEAFDTNSYSGSGSTWTNLDSSGSYSASLQNAPTFQTDSSLLFNGTDEIAQIANSAAIQPSVGTSLTIHVWAKILTGATGGIISKQYGSPSYDGYSLGIGANNSMYLKMNGQSVNDTYYSSNNVIVRDQWAMYTIVVRFGGGSGNPSKAYVSVRNIISGNNNESGIPSHAPIQIPRGLQEGGNYANAYVSAIYYYNTALSHETVIRNYDATRSRYLDLE